MDIIMAIQILKKINSIKYLGIIVNHKLNRLNHITYVKAKISKEIGIKYKAKEYLNKSSLKMYTVLMFIYT